VHNRGLAAWLLGLPDHIFRRCPLLIIHAEYFLVCTPYLLRTLLRTRYPYYYSVVYSMYSVRSNSNYCYLIAHLVAPHWRLLQYQNQRHTSLCIRTSATQYSKLKNSSREHRPCTTSATPPVSSNCSLIMAIRLQIVDVYLEDDPRIPRY
jgi:hypothetical protein